MTSIDRRRLLQGSAALAVSATLVVESPGPAAAHPAPGLGEPQPLDGRPFPT